MFHTAVHFITFHMRYTLKLAGNLDGAKLHVKDGRTRFCNTVTKATLELHGGVEFNLYTYLDRKYKLVLSGCLTENRFTDEKHFIVHYSLFYKHQTNIL